MFGTGGIPAFSQTMSHRHFVKAVVKRVKVSPSPDPRSPRHIYSIRVVEPSIFHLRADIGERLNVSGTPINVGSLYDSDLYRFEPKTVKDVLHGIISSGARTMEVKVSDEAGGPWEIIRVHLPD
jgi:hypothetical protein